MIEHEQGQPMIYGETLNVEDSVSTYGTMPEERARYFKRTSPIWRQGRKNKLNIYEQWGVEPSDNDRSVCQMHNEEDAQKVCEALLERDKLRDDNRKFSSHFDKLHRKIESLTIINDQFKKSNVNLVGQIEEIGLLKEEIGFLKKELEIAKKEEAKTWKRMREAEDQAEAHMSRDQSPANVDRFLRLEDLILSSHTQQMNIIQAGLQSLAQYAAALNDRFKIEQEMEDLGMSQDLRDQVRGKMREGRS